MNKILLSVIALSLSMMVSAETNEYFEGFEGWNSSLTDWLPEGWTEECSSEEIFLLNEGVFTWHVGGQSGFIPYPPEGSAYAKIYYANKKDENGKNVDLPQDEWMISPVINITENSKLSFYLGFSPLYLFDLNNENIDWSKMDFINKKPSTTLKVHARCVGGEWMEIFDIYKEWEDVPFSDLFNSYSSSSCVNYEIDFPDEIIGEIQIAYQFVGMYGNTMEVDAIRINDVATSISTIIENRQRPTVSVVGNNFVINPLDAKIVDVISSNAGHVMSLPIDGATTINHENLSAGVYLFRFDEGTVVKVIK